MDNEFCINLDRVSIGRAGRGMPIDEVDKYVGRQVRSRSPETACVGN